MSACPNCKNRVRCGVEVDMENCPDFVRRVGRPSGYVMSDESKRKTSESKIGQYHSKADRDKIRTGVLRNWDKRKYLTNLSNSMGSDSSSES